MDRAGSSWHRPPSLKVYSFSHAAWVDIFSLLCLETSACCQWCSSQQNQLCPKETWKCWISQYYDYVLLRWGLAWLVTVFPQHWGICEWWTHGNPNIGQSVWPQVVTSRQHTHPHTSNRKDRFAYNTTEKQCSVKCNCFAYFSGRVLYG